MSKVLMILFLTLSSQAEPSKEDLMKQVSELQKKLAAQSGNASSGGLKVNNMGGKEINAGQGMGQKMSPEQLKEIQKQLKTYKKQREEHQKYLDELMNE